MQIPLPNKAALHVFIFIHVDENRYLLCRMQECFVFFCVDVMVESRQNPFFGPIDFNTIRNYNLEFKTD